MGSNKDSARRIENITKKIVCISIGFTSIDGIGTYRSKAVDGLMRDDAESLTDLPWSG